MPVPSVPPHLRRSWNAIFAALLKWVTFGALVGGVVGVAGGVFHHALEWAAEARGEFPWLLWLLPAAGLLIVSAYHLTGMADDPGTELVITAIRSGERMHLRTAPLIFLATFLTHLTGGSAGREGAALQLGGSIANALGRMLSLETEDEEVITMCGIAAGFSALFGTPLTAAVFAMEVSCVGVMQYAALVPCLLAALMAQASARLIGVEPTALTFTGVPALDLAPMVSMLLLGLLCGVIANLFCRVMQLGGQCGRRIRNPWLRALLGGALVAALSLALGTGDYNGAGMEVIARALEGEAVPAAFALKMGLTALTLGFGFKGGEIVPSLFVGATFGCTVAPLLSLDPSFAAAAGMTAVFCGVTNSPITSILLGYELFGGTGVSFLAMVAAVSYMTSGYRSLYHQQKIQFAKTTFKVVDVYSGEEADE